MKKRQLFLYDGDEGSSGGGSGTGEGGEGTGEEGTGGTGDQGGSQGSTGTGQPEVVPRSELAKANAEAAKYRRERADLQKRLEELEGQGKTQLEQAQDRNKSLEGSLVQAQNTNRSLRAQIVAGQVGIASEAQEDAVRLLDWDKVTDPESPSAIKLALEELVKEKPYLMGNVPGGADGGAGRERQQEGHSMNDLLRAAAGR